MKNGTRVGVNIRTLYCTEQLQLETWHMVFLAITTPDVSRTPSLASMDPSNTPLVLMMHKIDGNKTY